MDALDLLIATTGRRRVFETWSIELSSAMAETYVSDGSYWHAWDTGRSVSLTSVVLTDRRGRPVPASELMAEAVKVLDADAVRVDDLPPGLDGCAATIDVPDIGRGSRALSGVLVAEGRLLIATLTSNDQEWARNVWLSIRLHPVSVHGQQHEDADPAHA